MDEEITVKNDEISFKEKDVKACGKVTVLLAEDEEDLREITANILKSIDITVIEAKDGEDEVTKFMENKDKVLCVILDLAMHKRGGMNVYTEIKKIKPDIKALFTGGYPTQEIIQEGKGFSELHYLQKPVDFDELLKKISELTGCVEY